MVQIIMAMAGIAFQFELQGLNRIYLGLTVVGLLMALSSVRSVEKGKRQLYSGLAVLAVSTILELLNFIFIDKISSGRILILGICLFIVKCGIDLIRNAKAVQKTDMEQEFLTKMAYADGMTHLGNRCAYEREQERLEKKEDAHITILIVDISRSKKTEISGFEIVYGVAEGSAKEIEDIFHNADNRMYSRKKDMRRIENEPFKN